MAKTPPRLLVPLTPDTRRWLKHRRKTLGLTMSKQIVACIRAAMEGEKNAKRRPKSGAEHAQL